MRTPHVAQMPVHLCTGVSSHRPGIRHDGTAASRRPHTIMCSAPPTDRVSGRLGLLCEARRWCTGSLLILHNLGQDTKARKRLEGGPATATRAVRCPCHPCQQHHRCNRNCSSGRCAHVTAPQSCKLAYSRLHTSRKLAQAASLMTQSCILDRSPIIRVRRTKKVVHKPSSRPHDTPRAVQQAKAKKVA